MSNRPGENFDSAAKRVVHDNSPRPKRIEAILKAQPLNETKKGMVGVVKIRGEVSVTGK